MRNRRVILLKTQSYSNAKNSGGLEKHAHCIAMAFVQRGAAVTWITNSIPKNQIKGVRYHLIETLRWPRFLRLEQFDRKVSAFLQKEPVDIVLGMDRNREQTHIRAGNGVHASYLRHRSFPTKIHSYWASYCSPFHKKILEIEKASFENCALKKIFVNSLMVRKNLLEHYSIDPLKIHLIYNGIEWKALEQSFLISFQARAKILQQFGLDQHCFHLLFIGNGYRRKGLIQLLDALSHWKFREFDLSIVGQDKNISHYRAVAKKMGLSKKVFFFGYQKDLTPFYQMADVMTIPSFYDPFANVTLEALSFGLFVVSSITNGGSEILNSSNGTCIENLWDRSCILAALDRALTFQKNPESGARIRATVSHFDFSKQLVKLIDACG